MVPKKKFLYCLRPNLSAYYYVQAGLVFTSPTQKPLQNDILEWRETDLQWGRDPEAHGVFRSFIIPLGFPKDGATILRHIFTTQEGIESVCVFEIHKLNSTSQQYDLFYRGDIDFSRKRNTKNFFQVAVMDSGLAAIIRAKKGMAMEIPILDSDCLLTYMHGLRLRNTSMLTLANDPLASNTWHQMMPTITIQNSESQVQVDVIEQVAQQGLGTTALWQGFPFFKATIAGDVIIEYDISLQVGNSAGSSLGTQHFSMVIWRVNAANNAVNGTFVLYTNTSFTSFVGLNLAKGSKTIPMQPGEKLVYFAGLSNGFNSGSGSDAFVVDHTYNYSTLTVRYDLRLAPNVIKGYRYFQLYQKLITKITDGQYTGVSTLLSTPSLSLYDSKPHNTIVSSGDAVRGLSGATYLPPGVAAMPPAKIKITLDELHRDAAGCWMAGYGVEGDTVRMERLDYFYQNNSVIVDLGEVEMPEDTPALEMIYNELKIGPQNYDYDALNGKDEPNTTQIYGLPIIKRKESWDMVSPWRDDMYGIEIMRANLSNKKTTDSSSDNDTFVMEVEDSISSVTYAINGAVITTNAYRLAQPQNKAGNSATGLIAADTAFNLMRTGKRKLYRNGPRIHAALHQQDAKTITFQTSDKNSEVISNLGSGTIIEKAPVPVSSLPAPLFLPVLFQFETKVPVNIPQLIAANPYGRVNFSVRVKGRLVQLGGFIYEVGIRPADNAVYTWKLLCCPDVDLGQLVY